MTAFFSELTAWWCDDMWWSYGAQLWLRCLKRWNDACSGSESSGVSIAPESGPARSDSRVIRKAWQHLAIGLPRDVRIRNEPLIVSLVFIGCVRLGLLFFGCCSWLRKQIVTQLYWISTTATNSRTMLFWILLDKLNISADASEQSLCRLWDLWNNWSLLRFSHKILSRCSHLHAPPAVFFAVFLLKPSPWRPGPPQGKSLDPTASRMTKNSLLDEEATAPRELIWTVHGRFSKMRVRNF